MKKIILNLLFVCLSISGFSQSYQTALKKLNDFLKTFDNGYYGYMEIKDGYLYDRFKNGNDYCRGKMAEMDYAFEKEKNRKVDLACKGTNLCVYSTFTNGNYNSFTFSQSTDFNTSELITLLNNFVKAYHKNSTSKNTEDEEYGSLQDDLDKYKSNIDIMNSGSNQKSNSSSNTSTTKTVSSQDYKDKAQKALQELNDYMVTLYNGRYKGMEVKDGYIIQNYGGGQTSKAKIEDIDRVEINTEYNYAKLACKGDSKCVYSSITSGYHDYFNFNIGNKSITKMETLLNNFLTALKKANSEYTTSYSKTTTPVVKTEAQKIREQKEKERLSKSNSKDDDDFYWVDEDFELTDKEKSSLTNLTDKSKNIPKGTKLQITGFWEKEDNLANKKKYIGQIGTAEYDIIENNTGIYSCGIRFNGEDKPVTFYGVKFKIVNNSSNKQTSTSNYSEPLKKLNEYLKTFNKETYREIEVKEGKVYFTFYVYGAIYKSSISINELKNNTIITIGKSVGSFKTDEVKISCKGGSNCFYSTYSNSGADHFRFFSNNVKDFTNMEQLVKDFIKAL
jgi:hypothetical protein